MLQAPLVIPQSLLAFGLTMLAVQAAALLVARWLGIDGADPPAVREGE